MFSSVEVELGGAWRLEIRGKRKDLFQHADEEEGKWNKNRNLKKVKKEKDNRGKEQNWLVALTPLNNILVNWDDYSLYI